jgi:hypothetical protein
MQKICDDVTISLMTSWQSWWCHQNLEMTINNYKPINTFRFNAKMGGFWYPFTFFWHISEYIVHIVILCFNIIFADISKKFKFKFLAVEKSCDRQILHTGSTRDPLYVKLKIFEYTCKTTSSPGHFLSIWPPLWISLFQLVNINTIYLSAKFGGNWVTIAPEISNYIFGHVTVSKRWRHRWTFGWWRFSFFFANQSQQTVKLHFRKKKSFASLFAKQCNFKMQVSMKRHPGLLGLTLKDPGFLVMFWPGVGAFCVPMIYSTNTSVRRPWLCSIIKQV